MSSKQTFRALPRRVALLGLLAAAGCGLSPVYGPNGNATALRGTINFESPQTVAGYQLRARLIDRLGEPETVKYSLSISSVETPTPASITLDGDTTRFNVFGTAIWSLKDVNGTQVAEGDVETFTSYSATGSTVATQTAKTDAQARLSIALADLIVARLLLMAQERTR